MRNRILKIMAIVLVVPLVLTTAFAMSEELLWERVKIVVETVTEIQFDYHPDYEEKEENEIENMWSVAFLMFLKQMKAYKDQKNISPEANSVRDAHAKGHGCVAAQFKVTRKIAPELQTGIFSTPGRTFQSLVRFSNGAGQINPDGNGDSRGMAIKLLNVNSLNLIGTGLTQDFLLIDNPILVVKDIAGYLGFLKDTQAFMLKQMLNEMVDVLKPLESNLNWDIVEPALRTDVLTFIMAGANGNPQELGSKITTLLRNNGAPEEKVSVLVQRLFAHLTAFKNRQVPRELKAVTQILTPKFMNSINATYFSVSPYLLRKNGVDSAVKYVFKPVHCNNPMMEFDEEHDIDGNAVDPLKKKVVQVSQIDTDNANFLRQSLIADLNKTDRCFDFYIQMLPKELKGEAAYPYTEDTLNEWTFPYANSELPVARLRIKKQNINFKSKTNYCENLSFNPWQAQPEHRPIGAINRSRKLAVLASSIRRHLLNKRPVNVEPKSVKEYTSLK